jgi:hypothetical protein
MQTPLNHPNDNERINAEIRRYGDALFRSLRKHVFKEATADTDATIHKDNRRRFLVKIAETTALAPTTGISALTNSGNRLGAASGTLSSKASREIDSM